ncbi:hypothetical protein GCM10022267_52130 [Lentzea roselyniae]|uniref:Alpha/beta hydrolase family protein n=1 Tax=Lentzea roselyniae TaxID=531940 RepID=A0ABP7BHJ4_9PSEU
MADAVVFPGGRSGPTSPLTMRAGEVAERRGARVHRHVWSGKPPMPWGPQVEQWACGEATAVLGAVGGRPLLIGKSLGNAAAAVAAERSLPSVWLTPLLTEPWVVAALGRASVPFLLVGGTADRWWDGTLARRLSPHVLEVQDADHDLRLPGSDEGLSRAVAAVEEFLDSIGWPG